MVECWKGTETPSSVTVAALHTRAAVGEQAVVVGALDAVGHEDVVLWGPAPTARPRATHLDQADAPACHPVVEVPVVQSLLDAVAVVVVGRGVHDSAPGQGAARVST